VGVGVGWGGVYSEGIMAVCRSERHNTHSI